VFCTTQWMQRHTTSSYLENKICHAQSLAATNRVTEQLSWLTVESFFMSCSISWMASLIDNLYLLDLIDSFGNQLTTCEL
jgi:hypothetical protein